LILQYFFHERELLFYHCASRKCTFHRSNSWPCDAFILGAWGCGVFQNNPTDVAHCWLTHLNENELFKNRFSQIAFAVFDLSKKQDAYQAFLERFT
jgi:uncharacterized protein (TIGR02452 family)